jgi:uncharacterized protein (TIGR02231 family)
MQVDLNAPIQEVTVYTDQALIIRRGSVSLSEAGPSAITLSGLPALLNRESLRATARATIGARLVAVDIANEFHPAAPEEQLTRLRDDIAARERELEALNQRAELIERQRSWLDTLGEQSARSLAYGLTRRQTQPEDATRVFSFTRDESERQSALLIETRAQRQRKQEELEAKRREYGALVGGQGVDRLRAIIRVELDAPGDTQVEVSYLVPAARWIPRYDARVNTQTARVRLSQQALVTQWTGEDWLGASLSLSTARPSAAVTLPDEAPPWFIDQARPPEPRVGQAMSMRAPAALAARFSPMSEINENASALKAERFAAADFTEANIERAGAAQVFRVGGSSDVPSDGQPHTVGLGDSDLSVTLEYFTAPVVAPGAHLRAAATNTTGHTLPAGSLHAFHVGLNSEEYVGETYLEAVAENAPLKLYLGLDDSMTVKRELVERDTDRASILQGGVRRTALGYRVTIANRTPARQRVTLLDRLPVSKHERIKVKPLDINPKPTNQSGLDQITWALNLEPGEERKIEWRVQVESPADMDVTGLP